MRLFITILLVLFSDICTAQKISDLSPEQIKEDLLYLERELEKHNPALYIYNSKEEIKKHFNSIRNSVKEKTGAIQFHKLLCLSVASANEGHITTGGKNDEFYKGFFNEEFKSLPLEVRFIENRIFVWRNFSSDTVLQKGDEILSVNGNTPSEIRKIIFRYTASDGTIETYKQSRLSKELSARYFWFVEQPDVFLLEYRKRGSEGTKEVQLPALSRPEMSKWSVMKGYESDKPMGIDKLYNLNIDKNTATLTLRDFDEKTVDEYDIHAFDFYYKIFKRLRQNKIKNLIIDVRDNIGGLKEFGDDILPFVLQKNKKEVYRELINREGEVHKSYLPKRNRWFFKGNIFVLVNGATFSTAAHIAKYLREFVDAITIGEETGSRYEGFAAGTIHYSVLPHSKIKIGIPNLWVRNIISKKQETKNRGLLPDYPVNPEIIDLLENKDRVKQKALELISEQ
jgi:hypothetical protein